MKLVEEEVPWSEKTLFSINRVVLTPEPMKTASVFVLATADEKAKATFPNVCVEVVLLVKDSRGARVAPVFVVSKAERENRLRMEVPPTTMAEQFPLTLTSDARTPTGLRWWR